MDLRDHKSGASSGMFWFRARRGLIRSLLGWMDLKGTHKVLDIGSGTGEHLSTLCSLGSVTALDLNRQALGMIDESLVDSKLEGDICNLDFPDSTFDIVTAFDVLEHVRDHERAVEEACRVLHPGGHLIITVPAYQWMRSAHDRALGHKRRYTLRTVRSLLGKRFEIVRDGYWMCSPFPLLAVSRLVRRGTEAGEPEVPSLPAPVDNALCRVLEAENFIIRKGINLPFGSTVYAIARKGGVAPEMLTRRVREQKVGKPDMEPAS